MRFPRRYWLALSVLVLLIACGGAATSLMYYALTPAEPGVTQIETFLVEKGASRQQLSERLVEKGIIKNAARFLLLGRILGQWKNLKTGEYGVSRGMTPIQILRTLTSGINYGHGVTLPEGANLFQIAKALGAAGLVQESEFVKTCRDPHLIETLDLSRPPPVSVEGYLFPETYRLDRTMSSERIIRKMVSHFQEIWDSNKEVRARELGMTRHAVVTLASMIEKETGAPEERATISSVFHNRIRIKMRLQSDPTTIYGIWEQFSGNITRADLLKPTPYNTYAIAGLPIGPICNPGKEAVLAALYPQTSNYLYFVSRNDGTHEFTSTFEEHRAAVKRYQLTRENWEGKSWRDHLQHTGADAPPSNR